MKIWSIVLTAAMALSFGFAATNAEAAKRLGGGKSVGQQSSNVTKRDAAPATPAAPAAAPGAAAAAPKKPWGAMLGGLAAGLGLAWLASSLGLGGAMANIMMFALLAIVAVVVIGFVMRKMKGGGAGQGNSPFATQGAGNASTPRGYSPENVGNDASARPWERNSMAFDANKTAGTGSMIGSGIGSGLSGSQSWGVPADFDADGFLKACKANFMTLQDAWDRSDINSLRAMMTDDMLSEIKTQLAERESHTGVGVNKTDVQMLDAKLLGIEELADVYMASVEFSGMIREDASAGASPFREVWNMTKPRSGAGGWLVAGVQALQ
jgi:predicted lipid-binding transport protein (Tim44 family)